MRRLPDNPCMNESTPYALAVQVHTRFDAEKSRPEDDHYVFVYTIRLHNAGQLPVQLLKRHWLITDANGSTEEVTGEGVVGETPWMRPGDDFEYTSGAVLRTDVGTMRGSYQLVADDGTHFEASIPQFTLSIPRTLH
jgi:ApaG protein